MRPRHAAMADRRLLFVGGAAALGALIVLVLILTADRSGWRQSSEAPNVSPQLLATQEPDHDANSRVLIGANRKPSGDPLQSIQTGRGELEFTNDEGLLAFRYRWDKSDPLETGWNRFTNPQAWIYRSHNQLIHLSADEGRFRLAENRQPQAGVLQGHVVVSLFESADPRGAYAIDPGKALPVAQFETDSLNFDAVQFSGHTEDRVIARTREAIIIGQGMNLLFNEKQGRIEKLEIARRELIGYRQESPASSLEQAARPSSPSADAPPRARFVSDMAPPAAKSPGEASEAWPKDATAYRLTLTDEVIISQGEEDDLLTIHGHDLVADFSIVGGDAGSPLLGDASPREARAQRGSAAPLVPLGPMDWRREIAAMPFALVEPEPAVRFLGADRGPGPQDVQITGDGGLLLVPIDETNEHLVNAQDLHATLQGEPVRIDYGPYYAVGSELWYSRSAAMARLDCSRDQPIEAGLPNGARLTSVVPFDFDFTKNRGTLMGAGTLIGLSPPSPSPAPPPPSQGGGNSSSMRGLPEGFSVNWLDDFTVEFSQSEQSSGLGRLAAATFNGAVHVDDPNGYALDSQSLRIGFKDKTDTEKNQQLIDSITASGEANLQSGDGNVSGDELFVQFQENARGEAFPSQMTVTGHGRVVDAGGSIAAQYIQANLVERDLASQEALPSLFGRGGSEDGEDPSRARLGVTDLLAQGGVLLSLGEGVSATADRLEADARTDTAVLTGENVIVSDPSLSIMGKRAEITNISSNELKRIARFVGAGTLTYFEQPANARDSEASPRPATTPEEMREELRRRLEAAPVAPAVPQTDAPETDAPASERAGAEPGNSVRVDWTDLLTFEEESGRITFEGDVIATSQPSPLEVDRLSGNWMQIQLSDPVAPPPEAGPDAKAKRVLRKLTVLSSGDRAAELQAQRFADEAHSTRELLLAVSSEIIEYTNVMELFEAIGEGWMLVVDATPNGAPAAPDQPQPAVQFSGRGETEFTWTGRLSLHGSPGLLTIKDDVTMRHRPPDQSVIRVDCDHMTASLRSSGSVAALDMSERDGMELTHAVAEGSVFVRREDRRIWADRLTYERSDGGRSLKATIESFDDNYVVMESDATGGAVQARRIFWDFYTNGITVEGARVDAPMPPINSR